MSNENEIIKSETPLSVKNMEPLFKDTAFNSSYVKNTVETINSFQNNEWSAYNSEFIESIFPEEKLMSDILNRNKYVKFLKNYIDSQLRLPSDVVEFSYLGALDYLELRFEISKSDQEVINKILYEKMFGNKSENDSDNTRLLNSSEKIMIENIFYKSIVSPLEIANPSIFETDISKLNSSTLEIVDYLLNKKPSSIDISDWNLSGETKINTSKDIEPVTHKENIFKKILGNIQKFQRLNNQGNKNSSSNKLK